MHGVHAFLLALTVVFCVAAVTTVLFQRIRQPVVLGYILAGLVVGPHVPIPLVADREIVQTLAELGVILLMFALGLEFRLRKLVQVGPTAGVTAIVQSSIMVWLGFVAGRALGWTTLESVFAGAMVAMSSTTIIAKAFDDLRVRGALRDLVVGVLLVEDLFAILFMAVLAAVATGAGVSPGQLGVTLGRLGGFLALLLAAGMLVVPRGIRYVKRRGTDETLLVASLGLCFGAAYLALAAGYSVALGAFLAGSLVAESGEGHAVEALVRPVRDLFAAVFFVSVGMLIDPRLVAQHWGAVLLFIVLVLAGKSLAVWLGALLTGNGVRTSTQAALSLAQIGEFSFILAALGASLGATRDFLYPLAVAVSAVTTLTTPWLIGGSGRVAEWIDHRLPARLQTVLSLYGSWLEQLRASPRGPAGGAPVKRTVRALLIDVVAVIAIVTSASVATGAAARWIAQVTGLAPRAASAAVWVAAALAALPFCVGLLRNTHRLGLALASRALPDGLPGAPDLAAAPRRALIATLQLGAVLLVLLPIVAITQPFLPGIPGAVVIAATLLVLGIALWRSAANLEGHVRAGAQVIVEALARQGQAGETTPHEDALGPFRSMFPGLGEPVAVRLRAGSTATGRSLSELEVRGRTGASVLAITRGGASVVVPTARERVHVGDVLALAGTHEAIEAARALLDADLLTLTSSATARPGSGSAPAG
jgi:CPA2 family monovalent cation:H+ antiporter-2